MTKKIFRSIMLVAGIVLLAGMIIIMGCLYDYFAELQKNQMEDTLNLVSVSVEQNGIGYLETVDSERYRLTWVDPSGNVIYDTKSDAGTLENHADRSEIRSALENGEGFSTRYSSTLFEKTMYFAKRLSDGTVLRISVSRASVGLLLLGMIQPVIIILVAAFIFSDILARRIAKRIVSPLNELDLDHPLDNDVYEELSPLLNRLNRQRDRIYSQMRELTQKTNEFSQITGSMREGLVLLDNRGVVLNINPAAKKLFGADDSAVGKDFLTIDRNSSMTEAIKNAFSSGHGEIRSALGGAVWQFDISRIDTDGEPVGAVILAFDITEREKAEEIRREFTANVSHELRTPLQGIIGSAELIENGMVSSEDLPRFVGHIRSEASRLVTLTGDIIRLSELDEGKEMPREPVDLLSLAKEAVENLQGQASKRNVTLSVDGVSAAVNGVRGLLYEVVCNLCDNAIKYNVDGGSVSVRVDRDDANAYITVADTGIGIAKEDQSRVFERFWRVDKSRSKASGGTGLGLSIVKHAVQYHNGSIELESEPGKGTTIRVTLPL